MLAYCICFCLSDLLHLQIVLDEALQMINFIKSLPLRKHFFFNILCDGMGSMHKAPLLHIDASRSAQGEARVIFELPAELATFFMEHQPPEL